MPIQARWLLVLLAFAFAGCVMSRQPLLKEDTRVLPLVPGTRMETYERAHSHDPWKKGKDILVLGANQKLEVFPVGPDGQPDGDHRSTFHPLGGGRFLMQTETPLPEGGADYNYLVLEAQAGEYVITFLDCEAIDQAAFKAAGGTVDGVTCRLDTAPDPLGLLRKLAEDPKGPQARWVPVR